MYFRPKWIFVLDYARKIGSFDVSCLPSQVAFKMEIIKFHLWT